MEQNLAKGSCTFTTAVAGSSIPLTPLDRVLESTRVHGRNEVWSKCCCPRQSAHVSQQMTSPTGGLLHSQAEVNSGHLQILNNFTVRELTGSVFPVQMKGSLQL